MVDVFAGGKDQLYRIGNGRNGKLYRPRHLSRNGKRCEAAQSKQIKYHEELLGRAGRKNLRAARRHSHGISEAWITSGTPSPPTERMARSTSSSPKRWVVIRSSGKRLEASCAKASSQAL